jgi:hypothetical protein
MMTTKIRLLLAAATAAGILALCSVPWPRDPNQPKAASWHPVFTIKGNMNGVPLDIPSNWLFTYPMEYADKSAWEGPKPTDKRLSQRTHADALNTFTLYLRWPDFASSSPALEKTPYAGYGKGGDSEWMLITLSRYYKDTPQPPKTPDNGLARVLRGRIEGLSKNSLRLGNEESPRLHPEIAYALKGVDPATSLNWAVPEGPGTEQFEIWNKALFWGGDLNKNVSPLIVCYHGTIQPGPGQKRICRHEYELPELGAYVTVAYTSNWLPLWRDIQARSREQVLSLRAQPIPIIPAPPVEPTPRRTQP